MAIYCPQISYIQSICCHVNSLPTYNCFPLLSQVTKIILKNAIQIISHKLGFAADLDIFFSFLLNTVYLFSLLLLTSCLFNIFLNNDIQTWIFFLHHYFSFVLFLYTLQWLFFSSCHLINMNFPPFYSSSLTFIPFLFFSSFFWQTRNIQTNEFYHLHPEETFLIFSNLIISTCLHQINIRHFNRPRRRRIRTLFSRPKKENSNWDFELYSVEITTTRSPFHRFFRLANCTVSKISLI